jgi:monoterpene epsilon-lactone hydrolase
MSLRAEVLRACIRLLVKRRLRAAKSLDVVRRRLLFQARFVPRPPRGTETLTTTVGGVKADRIATPASRHDRHVLYLHGGSYLVGFPAIYRDLTWRIATLARARVTCIDYRLAPEHPFPAALDDAVAAYRGLLDAGADPRHVALMGDSAGGGLVFATLLRLRDEGTPLPAAAVAVSPWTDLTLSGESLTTKAAIDPMIPVERSQEAADLYLAGADARHPYASPLYGDPSGLPPVLIMVGTDDVLHDDAVRMAEKMRAAGCAVELEVWPRMWHVWHMLARVMPEARAAVERIAGFVDNRI